MIKWWDSGTGQPGEFHKRKDAVGEKMISPDLPALKKYLTAVTYHVIIIRCEFRKERDTVSHQNQFHSLGTFDAGGWTRVNCAVLPTSGNFY